MKIVHITGIPGIGKTTLMNTFKLDYKKNNNLIWIDSDTILDKINNEIDNFEYNISFEKINKIRKKYYDKYLFKNDEYKNKIVFVFGTLFYPQKNIINKFDKKILYDVNISEIYKRRNMRTYRFYNKNSLNFIKLIMNGEADTIFYTIEQIAKEYDAYYRDFVYYNKYKPLCIKSLDSFIKKYVNDNIKKLKSQKSKKTKNSQKYQKSKKSQK